MATTIVSGGGEDLTLDSRGQRTVLFQCQTKNCKKREPNAKHQKALPPEICRFIFRRAKTPQAKPWAELLCGALFCAKRSCEYSLTQRPHENTARTTYLCDIELRCDRAVVPHSLPRLHRAQHSSTTFGPQKAETHRDETMVQETTDDPESNPVVHWAFIIKRLISYSGCNPTWPAHACCDFKSKRFSDIKRHEILEDIKAVVDAIGCNLLGFTPDNVGTHNNRDAFTMMMCLGREPIHKQPCWGDGILVRT